MGRDITLMSCWLTTTPFLGHGHLQGNGGRFPGEDCRAYKALDYLIANVNEKMDYPREPEESSTSRKRRWWSGGGDTAMDCVELRASAGGSRLLCLSSRRENMPGSRREVANAKEEGVQFLLIASLLR